MESSPSQPESLPPQKPNKEILQKRYKEWKPEELEAGKKARPREVLVPSFVDIGGELNPVERLTPLKDALREEKGQIEFSDKREAELEKKVFPAITKYVIGAVTKAYPANTPQKSSEEAGRILYTAMMKDLPAIKPEYVSKSLLPRYFIRDIALLYPDAATDICSYLKKYRLNDAKLKRYEDPKKIAEDAEKMINVIREQWERKDKKTK